MEDFEELIDVFPTEVTYETAPEEKLYRFKLTGEGLGPPAFISYRLKEGEKLPHVKELRNKGNLVNISNLYTLN